MARLAWVAGLAMLVACGRTGCAGAAGAHDAAAATGPRTAGSYEIHEWGFIGLPLYPAEGSLPTMGGGPGHFAGGRQLGARRGSMWGAIGGKPILYVHLGPGTESVTFSARLDLQAGGSFVEHWPAGVTGTRDGHPELRWPEVRATRDGCDRVEYPAPRSAPCADLAGGYCEAAELRDYASEDAACLHVQGTDSQVLMYRARIPMRPPLEVVIDGETVQLVNHGPERIPARVLRVLRSADLGRTRALIADAPAPGGSVRLPVPRHDAMDGSGASAELGAALVELGMTPGERDAFMTAWGRTLLGGQRAPSGAADAGVSGVPEGLRPARDAVLYWWPRAAADRAAALSFEPAPTELRRALLVRVDLGASALRPSSPASVRVRLTGAWVWSGPLSSAVVRGVVQQHINEPRFCYDQGREGRSDLSGTVTVRATISPAGRVGAARMTGASLLNERITSCIVGAVPRWTFPASDDRRATRVDLEWTFDLTQGDP